MKTDQELRERLARAAAGVPVDTERRLEGIYAVARGRRRSRIVARAAAALVLVAGIVMAVRLLPADEDSLVRPGASVPTGRIAYLAPGRGDPALLDLFVIDVTTGERAPIEDGPAQATGSAQWSPDGSRLAFTVEENGGASYAIIVANADGSDPVAIRRTPKAEGTAGPDLIALAWSPDGTQIAYSGRTIGRGRTVAIINADGSGEPVVLDGLWTSVSWSRSGLLLLDGFLADEGQFDLYTARPDNTDFRRLTDDPAAEHAASWSPDGTEIVFQRAASDTEPDYHADVYVMDADGTHLRRLTTWDGLDLFPVWSPDGAWIAFASDRDATVAIRDLNRAGEQTWRGLSLYAMRADGTGTRGILDAGDGVALPLAWTAATGSGSGS